MQQNRLTPRSKFQTSSNIGRDDESLRLSLQKVIGTTALSASAVDYLPDRNVIATCAGSVAIVSHIDENLNITQRIFRAGPNTVAHNSSASFYNPSTPPGFRDLPVRQSIAKDVGSAIGSTLNHGDPGTDSPGISKANTRTRSASCLSLSRDGHFLAVGEVRLLFNYHYS